MDVKSEAYPALSPDCFLPKVLPFYLIGATDGQQRKLEAEAHCEADSFDTSQQAPLSPLLR